MTITVVLLSAVVVMLLALVFWLGVRIDHVLSRNDQLGSELQSADADILDLRAELAEAEMILEAVESQAQAVGERNSGACCRSFLTRNVPPARGNLVRCTRVSRHAYI